MPLFRSLATAFAAAAFILPAAAASAEPRPESALQGPAVKLAEAAYRRQLGPYAECVVRKADAELAGFLNSGAGSSDASRKARQLARSRPGCAAPRGKIAAAPLLLRGAIFEALYRRDFGDVVVPVTLTDVGPARYGGKASGDEILDRMRLGLFALFDCVVRKDPRRVAIMLYHEPDSDGEWLASGGVAEVFSQCRPKDLRLEFSTSFARPYLSEVRYTLIRLRHLPRP